MVRSKTIICFAGGTAGDLVVGVLDPRNCLYDNQQGSITLEKDRYTMKKFWLFNNEQDKDEYIDKVFKKYNSLPSHDVDFHINTTNRNVIGITCFDKSLRLQSAKRFKSLHRPYVWDSLRKVTDTETIDQYSNDILEISRKLKQKFPTIDLQEIIGGDLINSLKILGHEIPAEGLRLYESWLERQQDNEISHFSA